MYKFRNLTLTTTVPPSCIASWFRQLSSTDVNPHSFPGPKTAHRVRMYFTRTSISGRSGPSFGPKRELPRLVQLKTSRPRDQGTRSQLAAFAEISRPGAPTVRQHRPRHHRDSPTTDAQRIDQGPSARHSCLEDIHFCDSSFSPFCYASVSSYAASAAPSVPVILSAQPPLPPRVEPRLPIISTVPIPSCPTSYRPLWIAGLLLPIRRHLIPSPCYLIIIGLFFLVHIYWDDFSNGNHVLRN